MLKLLVKKRKKFNKFKLLQIWVFLKPNYPISKKSKNSRMGKGKGVFLRWVTKLNRGFILFEFRGINIYRLSKFNNQVTNTIGSKTNLINTKQKVSF